MLSNSQGIGHNCEGGASTRAGGEETAVYDVEVVNVVGAAVNVEDGSCEIAAHFTGATLVADDLEGGFATRVDVTLTQAESAAFEFFENFHPLIDEAVVGF